MFNHWGISSFLVYDESFFQNPFGVVNQKGFFFLNILMVIV